MTLTDIKEVVDGRAWLDAGLAKRFGVYQKVARAIGSDWAVSRAGANRASGDALQPADAAGLCLIHAPSGVSFRLVPGFSFHAGFAADELAQLRASLCAGPGGVDGLALPSVGGVAAIVAPFLVASAPLRVREVGAIIRLDGTRDTLDAAAHPDRVAFFRPEEATAALAHGPFRLPTAHEWEGAYRAGAQTPFPWGADVPASLEVVPAHPLELVGLGVFPEGTMDNGAYAVRGGALIHAPWTRADTGWAGLLAGLTAPWGADAIATLRPVFPLPR